MTLAPPPKAAAGDPIVCFKEHQVGSMLSTVPLSLPILAADVSITNSNLIGDRRKKVRCAAYGMGVSRINVRDHWTARLSGGWVK